MGDLPRTRLRVALLVIFFGGCATGHGADEPPKPIAGEVRLSSGRAAEYVLHFDRNSFQDSARLPDGLIALTTSGVLLRFDLPGIRLVRERAGSREITCLGAGKGGEVLAGLGDGRICRVNPTTLELTDVAKLQAAPVWIGWGQSAGKRPAGLVVVTHPTRPFERGVHWAGPYAVVNDMVTGKTYALEGDRSTFLLDGESRVWLGADNGEFAGRVTRVDLIKETITEIAPPPSPEFDEKKAEPAKKKEGPEPSKKKEDDEEVVEPEEKSEPEWEGVCGFIQLKDGPVWAFGGTSHMGMNSGNIIRVDEGKPRPLFAFDPSSDRGKPTDLSRPRLPITHILEEKDDLFILSYSDIFRIDKSLKAWKKAGTLSIQYRWGRPDAMGSYPSVQAVHPPLREGEPYIFATIGDGYVAMNGTKSTSDSFPGQFAASWGACGVENSSEGILVFDLDGRFPLWKLGAKGWEVVTLAPPFSDPANKIPEFERHDSEWYETEVLIGPGGAIYTMNSTGTSPGTRITGRYVGGKAVRLGRETSQLNPSSSFITADSTLWNTSSEDLKRFEDGGWKVERHLPRPENVPDNRDWGMPSRLEPINKDWPPWLLRDHYDRNLWRLDPGTRDRKPQLDQVELREGGKSLKVDAAISWSEGALLLATDAGLRRFDSVARKLSKVDIQDPPRPVRTLTRDGLGRLWISTDKGLRMLEIGGKTLESFDAVPLVWDQRIHALAPDPRHADGIIAALGRRGLAFIRTLPKQ